MKKIMNVCWLTAILGVAIPVFGQEQVAKPAVSAAEVKTKPDADLDKKAADWIATLQLNNPEKEKRLTEVVATHLKTVRDWHNEHPFTTVPAGINPVTGNPLTELDRQLIVDSAMPPAVHQTLMEGLRKDLDQSQVHAVLDRYTVGKVAFTMAGYRAIVPNITGKEEAVLLGLMEQAREQAVDYKSMKEISAIFEIYKTKAEQYLNANGRNWREMYNAYTALLKAQKAAGQKQNTH